MSTTINATLTNDGDGVASLPVDPPLLTYADLRGLAEYASGVRKGVTVWLAAYGDGRIEEVPDGAPRPGALVVGTVVGEGRGNRDSVEYAWIGPFEDGKEAVDLLEIWHDGETMKSDSVFWTQSAVEKFLLPYYASVAGGHAVTKIERLLGLLGSTVTVRARGPSELAPMEGEVFALIHLPQSEYVARADDGPLPTDLAVAIKGKDGKARAVHALDLVWP
ncbi:MAG TPA: hypothetical protein VF092_13255 [Longimicrobium sp.]